MTLSKTFSKKQKRLEDCYQTDEEQKDGGCKYNVTTMHQCLFAPSQHMAINNAETTYRRYIKARIEVKL